MLELEVDGQWYRWNGDSDAPQGPFGRGKEYKDIRITLTGQWVRKGPDQPYAYGENSGFVTTADPKPLVMAAGKHAIRVACYGVPTRVNTGGNVQAVSEPVTVTLLKAIGAGAKTVEAGHAVTQPALLTLRRRH